MRRSLAVTALLTVTAACGGSSPNESAMTAAPDPTDAPASTDGTTGTTGTTTAEAATTADTATADSTAGTTAADAATPGTAAPDASGEDPPATVAAPTPAWPDDGCSSDNAATAAAAADGPAPVVELRPESAASPLPDLAVRRINCKGGWENLRNELPADRPLLVWFWAPH